MLKRELSIKEIIKEAIDFLSQYIKVDSLILFGSYAYGKPHNHSDIDIAVVSDDFKNMSAFDKINLFAKTISAVDSRLELIGFLKTDYQSPQKASFLEMIKQKGKQLLLS